MGIGLTLVKNLIEMHGGTVEVHSPGLGRGSEFAVRLPLLAEPVTPVPPAPADEEPTTKVCRRILVVDDNLDSSETLAMLMDMAGHQTITAHDGID